MAPHITLTSITSYEVWFQSDQTPSQGLAPAWEPWEPSLIPSPDILDGAWEWGYWEPLTPGLLLGSQGVNALM